MLQIERKFVEDLLVAFSPSCFKGNVSEFLFSSPFFFAVLLATKVLFPLHFCYSKGFYLRLFLFLGGFTTSLRIF